MVHINRLEEEDSRKLEVKNYRGISLLNTRYKTSLVDFKNSKGIIGDIWI